MPPIVHSTPLVSVDGVVLDTETTGLDAGTARLVQFAAIRIAGETADVAGMFTRLVRPDGPIPPASTAIHGIGDEDVAAAPPAAAVLPDLVRFLGDSVVIGHTIGYDLAVLAGEAERAGLAWSRPRALDVRLLARLVTPALADYSLDGLCGWLNIVIEGRHTATGDALATARVFAALLPLLRQAGIRTLAEAGTACRRIEERSVAAGGAPAVPVPAEGDYEDTGALARIDSYPYTHRVRDVMSAPPAELSPEHSLRDAVRLLMDRGVSSVFVGSADGTSGIVTERDVLRLLHAKGAASLSVPLGEVRSTPLQSVSEDAFLYRAIGRMDRLGIRHLGVRDRTGAIVGAVTTRNLLRHRATAAMVLGDGIAAAADTAALGGAWAGLPLVASGLTDESVDPLMIAAVISSEIRLLTRRAAEIAEAQMEEQGRGAAPAAYALLVLGSAGRGESLLAADQDNAIVYRSGAEDDPQDQWFAELGIRITDILDRVGLPLCRGGVMARNRSWRGSLEDWRRMIDRWVDVSGPEDLLNVDIFFDAVPVHGEPGLGEEVLAYAFQRARRAPAFRRALSQQPGTRRRLAGLFGSIRTDAGGRADLKMGGLLPIVTAARILSIKEGIRQRGTPERLRGAAASGVVSPVQVEALIDAQRTILGAMLAQQIADAQAGVPLSPRVDPRLFGRDRRMALRAALRRVPEAADLSGEGVV